MTGLQPGERLTFALQLGGGHRERARRHRHLRPDAAGGGQFGADGRRTLGDDGGDGGEDRTDMRQIGHRAGLRHRRHGGRAAMLCIAASRCASGACALASFACCRSSSPATRSTRARAAVTSASAAATRAAMARSFAWAMAAALRSAPACCSSAWARACAAAAPHGHRPAAAGLSRCRSHPAAPGPPAPARHAAAPRGQPSR